MPGETRDLTLGTADEHRMLEGFLDYCRRAVVRKVSGGSVSAPRLGHTSLRWIYPHMIEETARHAGQLDILREQLDGTTRGLRRQGAR